VLRFGTLESCNSVLGILGAGKTERRNLLAQLRTAHTLRFFPD